MTNSSLSSVLKPVSAAVLAAVLLGCSKGDGSAEFQAGHEAYLRHDLKAAATALRASLACNATNLDAIVEMALVQVDLGEIAEARETLKPALLLAPDSPDVLLLAAEIDYHAKDYPASREDYRRVAANPSNSAAVRAEAYAGLGVVEMTENHFHLARIAFYRALRLDRRNAAAHYHLGLLYRDGFSFHEAARDELEKYVRLDEASSPRVQRTQRVLIPDLREAISRKASSRPGAAMRDSQHCAQLLAEAEKSMKAKAFKTARKHYEAALAADPLSALAAEGLAQVITKVDKTPAGSLKQLDMLELAAALKPDSIKAWTDAGDCAFRYREYARAAEDFSRALAVDPSKLEAVDGLIRALGHLKGQRSLAQAYQAYRNELGQKSR